MISRYTCVMERNDCISWDELGFDGFERNRGISISNWPTVTGFTALEKGTWRRWRIENKTIEESIDSLINPLINELNTFEC
jgi:hypothetical protein